MNNGEIELLSQITEEQAFPSDEDGDSDAENDLPVHLLSTRLLLIDLKIRIVQVASRQDGKILCCSEAADQIDGPPLDIGSISPLLFNFTVFIY